MRFIPKFSNYQGCKRLIGRPDFLPFLRGANKKLRLVTRRGERSHVHMLIAKKGNLINVKVLNHADCGKHVSTPLYSVMTWKPDFFKFAWDKWKTPKMEMKNKSKKWVFGHNSLQKNWQIKRIRFFLKNNWWGSHRFLQVFSQEGTWHYLLGGAGTYCWAPRNRDKNIWFLNFPVLWKWEREFFQEVSMKI